VQEKLSLDCAGGQTSNDLFREEHEQDQGRPHKMRMFIERESDVGFKGQTGTFEDDFGDKFFAMQAPVSVIR
jgi:hypothetical protein